MAKKYNWLSFEEARDFSRNLNFLSQIEWEKYCKSHKKPNNIPATPNQVYKDKWISWMNWLGYEFVGFIDARNLVKGLNISNLKLWNKYCKSGKIPKNIPRRPEKFYKDRGWVSWGDFLGTNNKSGGQRKYKVNDNYFKKWSHNMAYILGFWWADGCISGKLFNISQNKKSKYLLKQISKEMGSNYKIWIVRNVAYLNIYSSTIVNDIIRLGGKERKSLLATFPYIPKKYLPDFIRGLWDGDGCISCDNKTKKSYVASIGSGSQKMMLELKKTLMIHVNIKETKIHTRLLSNSFSNKGTFFYSFRLSTDDTIKLKNFMYNKKGNSLMLLYKYNKFKKVPRFHYHNLNRNFLKIFEARKIINDLNICSCKQWRKYCNSNKKPKNIPSNPQLVYKNKGWIDWYDWLGKARLSEKKVHVK